MGTATITVEVEVALFSTTISITATYKFAGRAKADPTLADVLASARHDLGRLDRVLRRRSPHEEDRSSRRAGHLDRLPKGFDAEGRLRLSSTWLRG